MKLTLDIIELITKSKRKNVLDVFMVVLKLTLYNLELMMKSKKKAVFNYSFLSNLVKGGHSLFSFFKKGL